MIISCKQVDLIKLGTSLVSVKHLPRVSRCSPLKEWIERDLNDIVITCHFFKSALKCISMTILPSCKANGLVWFGFMVFSTTFSNISVKMAVSYYCWRKSEEEDADKLLDLSQVNDKLYQKMLYTSP
jgi:hypothetical protein